MIATALRQVGAVGLALGIAAVASYAHDRGMLLGIYASPFDEICGQDLRIGSRGKETTDADTFASWGVDYLK